MTSNDRIEAALAALDKATPGRWMPSIHQAVETEKPDGTIKTVCICSPIDATLISAAPDLAAEVIRLRKWQSEAVQYLDDALEYLQNQISVWKEYNRHKVYQSALDDINRLIAEAEGEHNA